MNVLVKSLFQYVFLYLEQALDNVLKPFPKFTVSVGGHQLAGTSRYQRIRTSIENGDLVPPIDLRFLQKGMEKNDMPSLSKSAIISFLQGIFDSVAETLPDWRDDMEPGDLAVIAVDGDVEDPYSKFDTIKKELERSSEHLGRLSRPVAKPRAHKKSVKLDADRVGMEERFLPPGTMTEYFDQFKLACPEHKISFSTFWRTWYSSFSHMKFRGHTSHSICSVCVRHRLLIREMSAYISAREKQKVLYMKHLKAQYQDRVLYWSLRGSSRLRSNIEVTCIIDSMDQQKFCYPRGPQYQAKELSALIRPRAHITCVLVHGFFVLITVAEHNLPKNASCMVETLAYCLELLRTKHFVDTACIKFNVQSDNTVRECKNNICLRWLSSITANGALNGFLDSTFKKRNCNMLTE